MANLLEVVVASLPDASNSFAMILSSRLTYTIPVEVTVMGRRLESDSCCIVAVQMTSVETGTLTAAVQAICTNVLNLLHFVSRSSL